jgi:hypothetical protein
MELSLWLEDYRSGLAVVTIPHRAARMRRGHTTSPLTWKPLPGVLAVPVFIATGKPRGSTPRDVPAVMVRAVRRAT